MSTNDFGTLNLNLLVTFVTVAQEGSFTESARKLRMPRSSVSRSVAALEETLGVTLFNRTTRRVALSTAGAAFYARIGPQLAELQKSLGSLPERDETPSGDLRLTAPTDMGVSVLPELLSGFSVRYPEINLDVHLSSRLVDLVGEGFDCALRITTRLADSSLVARRLSGASLELFAAPTYLARHGTPRTLEDTTTHQWVTFRGQDPFPPFPKPVRRSRIGGDDMLFIYQAVRGGVGLGLVPSFLAGGDVASGHLVRVLPRVVIRTGALYFVYPKATNVSRKVTAFRDYLIEYLARHQITASGPQR